MKSHSSSKWIDLRSRQTHTYFDSTCKISMYLLIITLHLFIPPIRYIPPFVLFIIYLQLATPAIFVSPNMVLKFWIVDLQFSISLADSFIYYQPSLSPFSFFFFIIIIHCAAIIYPLHFIIFIPKLSTLPPLPGSLLLPLLSLLLIL